MKFKVGDKVKCVDAELRYSELTNGKEYIVESVCDNKIGITTDLGDTNTLFFSYRFELVPENKLPHELLGLPKYFVVKKDESDPLWDCFSDRMGRIEGSRNDRGKYYYVGYSGTKYHNGFQGSSTIDYRDNNPTLITLAERDRIVNKKTTYDDYCDGVHEEQEVSQTKKSSKPIRSCEYDGSIYKEHTIDGVSIKDMKATRDNINSKLLTHRNLFDNPKKR